MTPNRHGLLAVHVEQWAGREAVTDWCMRYCCYRYCLLPTTCS